MDQRFVLALTLVLAKYADQTSANWLSRCSVQCIESNKFRYTVGSTYRYRYDGNVLTAVLGASEGAAVMKLRGIADIEIINSCDFALTMRNVQLEETDQSSRTLPSARTEDFRRSIEADPLRFSWQDGRIEHLCPVVGEPGWVTNVKRGVLSALQNSMRDFERNAVIPETDVSGNCRAHYTIVSRRYPTVTVKKSKDLTVCTERQSVRTAMKGTPERLPPQLQSLPILKSNQECRQTISMTDGHVTRSLCEERHVIRPFSNEDRGATTLTSQTLVFESIRERVLTPWGAIMRRSTLLFEHEKPAMTASRDSSRINRRLSAICRQTRDGVRPETAQLFTDLVYSMKELDTVSLKVVHDRVVDKTTCAENHDNVKRYFYDALPMAETAASVSLISKLVIDNSRIPTYRRAIPDVESEIWITSFAFIQHPTREMLHSIKGLLDAPDLGRYKRSVYLAGSALVNNFCQTTARCMSDSAVSQIVEGLVANLRYDCRTGEIDMERILMSLKALTNIGYVPDITATLSRCFARLENHAEIRIGALEALERQPCSADGIGWRNAIRLYTSQSEDAEIRIAAYKAIIPCATDRIFAIILHTLESERVNHVGHYVWTHLKNMEKSSGRRASNIRRILQDVALRRRFDKRFPMLSRTFEDSTFIPSINAGAMVKGDIIWSNKSVLPKSARLGLTVDIFGASVNVLEIGGRVEGRLGGWLEEEFSSRPYFSHLGEILRTLRKGSATGINEDPKASVYLKIFGQEVRYVDNVKLKRFTRNLIRFIKESPKIFGFLLFFLVFAADRGINENLSKSVMFLDTGMTVPTVVGLPLKLSVNGSATINARFLYEEESNRTFDYIGGIIKPSAVLQINSSMSVDAHVARAGLKMVSTIHSSSIFQGKVEANDTYVSYEQELPRQKFEMLNATNRFYLLQRNLEVEQKMPKVPRVNRRRCMNATKLLGLEICGELSYPMSSRRPGSPRFPLAGPVSMSLVVNKKDTHSGYKIGAQFGEYQRGRPPLSRIQGITLNTPGSRIRRRFHCEYKWESDYKSFVIKADTPWTTASLNGFIKSEGLGFDAALRLASPFLKANLTSALDLRRNPETYMVRVDYQWKDRPTEMAQFDFESRWTRDKRILVDMSLQLTAYPDYNTRLELETSAVAKHVHIYMDLMTGPNLEDGAKRIRALATINAISERHREMQVTGGVHFIYPLKHLDLELTFNHLHDPRHLASEVNLQYKPGQIIHAQLYLQNESGDFAKYSGLASLTYPGREMEISHTIEQISLYEFETSSKIKWQRGTEILENTVFRREEDTYSVGSTIIILHLDKLPVIINGRLKPEIADVDAVLDVSAFGGTYRGNFEYQFEKLEGEFAMSGDVDVAYPGRHVIFATDLDARYGGEFATNGNLALKGNADNDDTEEFVIAGEFSAGHNENNYMKCSGQANMAYPGREMAISNSIEQTRPREYHTSSKVKWQRDREIRENSVLRQEDSTNFISSTIEIPNRSPIIIDGRLKPKMEDFEAMLKVNAMGDIHVGNLQCQLDEEEGEFTLTGAVDVKLPGRHIVGNADVTTEFGNEITADVDLKWDAEKDETKAMVIGGQYNIGYQR